MSLIQHDRWCGKFYDIPPGKEHDSEDCYLSRQEREARAAAIEYEVNDHAYEADPKIKLNTREACCKYCTYGKADHNPKPKPRG